jgi:hypothetical protein
LQKYILFLIPQNNYHGIICHLSQNRAALDLWSLCLQRISQKFGEIWSYLYFCSDLFKKYMMKRLLFSALAFVCMAGRAQAQEPLDSVDRLLELKEVVIRGDLPNTRLKGNAMITRVEGTPLSSSGTLGEMLVKVPGMTGTDEASGSGGTEESAQGQFFDPACCCARLLPA